MLSTRLQPPVVEYTRIIIIYLEKGDERRALLRLAAARPQHKKLFFFCGESGRATRRGHITSQSGAKRRGTRLNRKYTSP